MTRIVIEMTIIWTNYGIHMLVSCLFHHLNNVSQQMMPSITWKAFTCFNWKTCVSGPLQRYVCTLSRDYQWYQTPKLFFWILTQTSVQFNCTTAISFQG